MLYDSRIIFVCAQCFIQIMDMYMALLQNGFSSKSSKMQHTDQSINPSIHTYMHMPFCQSNMFPTSWDSRKLCSARISSDIGKHGYRILHTLQYRTFVCLRNVLLGSRWGSWGLMIQCILERHESHHGGNDEREETEKLQWSPFCERRSKEQLEKYFLKHSL